MMNDKQAHEAVVDEVFKVAPPIGYLIGFREGSREKEKYKG